MDESSPESSPINKSHIPRTKKLLVKEVVKRETKSKRHKYKKALKEKERKITELERVLQ